MTSRIPWFFWGVALTISPSLEASSLTVGGFNAARGGEGSIATNAGLQSLILSQFPGTTFSSTALLTSSYLSTVSDLIISVATTDDSAITPLSVAEQTALVDFVEAGGTALLFTDNSTFAATAPTVNNSFLSPFGLSATGTLSGLQSSTIVNSSNPVVMGPAGPASGFDTNFPGWFASIGSALEIAQLTANSEPDLAVLLPGALGPGSGAVVFFGDGNNLGGGGASDPNDNILILNSLALTGTPVSTTPEPTSAALLLTSVIVLSALRLRFCCASRGAALKDVAHIE
jgi:hypothetical protein